MTVTGPAFEPVSRADAKKWLRIEDSDTDHDTVVDLLIKAMREMAENLTLRCFIPRTLRLNLDDWPWDDCYGVKIDLPGAPFLSIAADGFQYIDANGDTQTLVSTDYEVHDEYEPAFIIPAWGASLPTIRRLPNALQITYRAGYDPGSPEDESGCQAVMPGLLRLWMQSKIAAHDVYREQVISGVQAFDLPRDHTDGLLDSLRLGGRLF